MFTKTVFALLTATATLGAVITRDESHNVQLIDNCGSGNAVFLHQGGPAQGSGTINGPLNGGVAWVDGFAGTDYQSSGGMGAQNSAEYSLLTDPSLGNHQFTYPVDFAFTNTCTNGPGGACTGNSAEQCPGAYLGSATEGGAPTQCLADDTGIVITF